MGHQGRPYAAEHQSKVRIHAWLSINADDEISREVLFTIGKKYDQYMDFRQQDAHEFLRHMLDAMRMEELDVSCHYCCACVQV